MFSSCFAVQVVIEQVTDIRVIHQSLYFFPAVTADVHSVSLAQRFTQRLSFICVNASHCCHYRQCYSDLTRSQTDLLHCVSPGRAHYKYHWAQITVLSFLSYRRMQTGTQHHKPIYFRLSLSYFKVACW